jgi:hypothetical protein
MNINKKLFFVGDNIIFSNTRNPTAWYKGEDNLVDNIQPGLDLVPSNDELTSRFADGVVGRCFIVDPQGSWDSLTIGGEGIKQAKTNISSFETWELELYIKIVQTASWFYIFQAYDYGGGVDFVDADIDVEGDYLEVVNQDIGPGDPYVKFENLGLVVGEWLKLRLKYTKATHKWELFIGEGDGIQKLPVDIDTMTVPNHEYTTFFAGTDWNGPVLNVDEIKIFTGNPT